MAEFPMFPLWTDAYLADTSHLTMAEHGAYLLLLIAMWRTPEKSLPNDDARLARFVRANAQQWARVKPAVMPFFDLDENNRLSQGRLRDEASAVQDLKKRQSSKAKARWLKTKETTNATAMPRECRTYASPTHYHNHKEEEEDAGAREAPIYHRVLVAVGLNPADVLPTYWLPPAAVMHVDGWHALGLSDGDIEAVAKGTRNGRPPPNGPRALDTAMQHFAAQKRGPALRPVDNPGQPPPLDLDAIMDRAAEANERRKARSE